MRRLTMLTVTAVTEIDALEMLGASLVEGLRSAGAIVYDARVVELGGHGGRVTELGIKTLDVLPKLDVDELEGEAPE